MKTRTDRWLYRRGPYQIYCRQSDNLWHLIRDRTIESPVDMYKDPAVPFRIAVERNRDHLLSSLLRHATGLAFCAFIVFLMWLIFTLVFSLGGVLAF